VAVEGAIGSMFKIDASYLSPNVGMAGKLEEATKEFGVPIIVSEYLFNILSDDIKYLCRELDRVVIEGFTRPTRLYTIDIDSNNMIEKEDRMQTLSNKERKKLRDKKKKNLWYSLNENNKTTWDVYSKDKEFKELRQHYNK
jgi:hypothetical protein